MKYDVAVIGSGPGGYVAAIRAGQLGLKTLVIERERIGGVCLNVGCIPTKALLHAAMLLGEMDEAKRMGLRANVSVDISALNRWKESVVRRLVKGIEFLFKRNGVEVLRGEGTLVAPGKVRVVSDGETVEVEAKNVILAMGARPKYLPNLRRDGHRIWDSNDAVSLPEVPESLLVVGAGAVGLEFAFIYRRLGVKRVVVVDVMEQVLPGTDSEMARIYERILRRMGVDVRLKTTVKEVSDDGRVVLSSEGEETVEEYEKVLLAIGRVPNSEGLREVGIELDRRGFVITDDRMRTNLPGVFAVGDLAGPPMLAHKAHREGILAAEVSAGMDVRRNWRYIPAVVYTYPEFATVGLTEERAREEGYDLIVGKFPLTALGKAHTLGGVDGMVKVVAERESGKLLGVHMVAPEASSLISEATLALESGLTLEEVERVIHPHPTVSEALMEAAANALKRAIHIVN
ncbi:MAG: dihydrolipoyl dehydrogenase [Thermotogae bacterium]|nr:dihydrolipoyl dehydrogenase [Thermotogota bacterium]